MLKGNVKSDMMLEVNIAEEYSSAASFKLLSGSQSLSEALCNNNHTFIQEQIPVWTQLRSISDSCLFYSHFCSFYVFIREASQRRIHVENQQHGGDECRHQIVWLGGQNNVSAIIWSCWRSRVQFKKSSFCSTVWFKVCPLNLLLPKSRWEQRGRDQMLICSASHAVIPTGF